jgi:CRP-like cAMP-binding protein
MPKRKLTAMLGALTQMSKGLKELLENDTTLIKNILKKGEFLLIPNMDADKAHYVYIGSGKLYWKDDDNEQLIFGFCLENEIILLAEEFFAGSKNQDVYLEILEDSIVYTITKVQMDEIYKDYPEAMVMTNMIRARLVAKWHAHTKLIMAKEGLRYKLFCNWFPELRKKNMPDKVLCAFLRVCRSTLVRSRTDYHIEERKRWNKG